MSLSSTNVARGQVHIQPAYFTSSLFVNPLREDIQTLTDEYEKRIKVDTAEHPFQVFKDIWQSHGWHWLHLKTLEKRAKYTFVATTCRLFVERTEPSQSWVSRVVGLFGLYAFFVTQPNVDAPLIKPCPFIAIPIDHLENLVNLSNELATSTYSTFRPYVDHILSKLFSQDVFHILPPSDLHCQNPRTLPREIVMRPDSSSLASSSPSVASEQSRIEPLPPKRPGRPSKVKKKNSALAALASLEKWLATGVELVQDGHDVFSEAPSHPGPSSSAANSELKSQPKLFAERPTNTLHKYLASKEHLLSVLEEADRKVLGIQTTADPQSHSTASLPSDIIHRASAQVLTRLKHIEDVAKSKGLQVGEDGASTSQGLERVKRVINESGQGGQGLLGLLKDPNS